MLAARVDANSPISTCVKGRFRHEQNIETIGSKEKCASFEEIISTSSLPSEDEMGTISLHLIIRTYLLHRLHFLV